jgi:transposase InsO family protein
MDGYSLKILSWGLFERMGRLEAEIVLMKARRLYPEAHPRIITDNGSRFISKDFREFEDFTPIGVFESSNLKRGGGSSLQPQL